MSYFALLSASALWWISFRYLKARLFDRLDLRVHLAVAVFAWLIFNLLLILMVVFNAFETATSFPEDVHSGFILCLCALNILSTFIWYSYVLIRSKTV